MSKSVKWFMTVLTVVISVALLCQVWVVAAAPPTNPLMGLTPTATFTTTPTATPTVTPTPTTPVSDDESDSGRADPVIVKLGDPSSAFPGEEVTFTIQVFNQGKHAVVDVVVTDDMPQYLDILEVTTTQGTVTIEGQKVVVDIGVVGPEFTVQIVIRTRVREDTPAPLELENLSVLKSSNAKDQSARVVITILRTALPVTGGLWMSWGIPLALTCGLLGVGIYVSRKTRREH